MARKTIVTLVDDLDGSKASETVQFALDGVAYQIDLSSLNASKLRDGLAEYVARARRPDGTTRPTTSGATARAGRPTSTDNAGRPVSGQRPSSAAHEVSTTHEVSKVTKVTKVSKAREVGKAPEAVAQTAEGGHTADAARDRASAQASRSDSGEGTAKVGRPPVVSPFKAVPVEEQPAPEPAPAKPAKGTVPTVTFKAAK